MEPVELVDVLDSLLEGLQVLGPDWRYRYVNDAAATHGRRPRAELVGRTMLECYPGIEATPVFAVLARCMRERAAETLETEFEYPDGARGFFELRIRPYRDGLIVLSLDVGERKRLARQIAEGYRLRALGQMASGVAHDLGNLLNPIGLELVRLGRRVTDPEATASIERIAALVGRGGETVARLRDYGRADAASTPVELDAVVGEATSLCRERAAPGGGAVVIRERLGAPPAVLASGSELLAALVNLVVNAIDAMPGGGSITLRTGAGDGVAWVEVEDTGAGMSERTLARLGEPFFTTKGAAGTGLGFANVQAFLRRHGGTMQVRSAPGAGTTITLALPLA